MADIWNTFNIALDINWLGAIFYTAILFIFSHLYLLKGRQEGIHDTLVVMKEHEPQAFQRLRKKLKDIIDESDFEQQPRSK